MTEFYRQRPGLTVDRPGATDDEDWDSRLPLLDSYMINMFALSPDTSLTTRRPDQSNPTPLALVGAHYLFARYVADCFGAAAVFPAVFSSSGRGIDAYDRYFHTLQPATSFDAVFADWVVAN